MAAAGIINGEFTADWIELGHIITLLIPHIHGRRSDCKRRRGWYSNQPATEVILFVGFAMMYTIITSIDYVLVQIN